MDKIKKYQEAILDFFEEQAPLKYSNTPDVKNIIIADKERNHFMMYSIGWDGMDDFVHSCVFHFDIINEKIWVQANWTEIEVGEALMERGVERQDIVAGFQPVYTRPYSGYGVG